MDVTTGAVCRIHDLTKKSERILNDCVCTVVEKLDADPNHPDALPKVKVTIDETAPKNFVPQPGKEEYKPPKDLVGTEVEVSILNLETDETDETHEARVKKIELEQVLTPLPPCQCKAPLQSCGCQWCANGVPMVCQWCANGVPMVCRWCADGVPLSCTACRRRWSWTCSTTRQRSTGCTTTTWWHASSPWAALVLGRTGHSVLAEPQGPASGWTDALSTQASREPHACGSGGAPLGASSRVVPPPHAGIILYITVLYNLDMPAGINLFDDMQDQLNMEVAVATGREVCPDGQTCTVIQLKTCALWKKCGESISQFTDECGFGVCAIPDVECGDGICVAEDLGWSQVWEAPHPSPPASHDPDPSPKLQAQAQPCHRVVTVWSAGGRDVHRDRRRVRPDRHRRQRGHVPLHRHRHRQVALHGLHPGPLAWGLLRRLHLLHRRHRRRYHLPVRRRALRGGAR